MKKIIATAIAMAMLPAVTSAQSANDYVNADYLGLSYNQFSVGNADLTGFALHGRSGVSANGKITYRFGIVSLNDVDVTRSWLGYRHSFPSAGGFVVSVSGGFVASKVESPVVAASETNFYLGVDAEMGVGSNGVLHGLFSYDDTYESTVGIGYTHYVTQSVGLRAEATTSTDFDELSLGVNFRF